MAAEGEATDEIALEAGDARGRPIQDLEDLLDVAQQLEARLRRRDAAAVAQQQLARVVRLEVAHRHR
ncbi:hypothetical protein G6O69_06160 [Pseudenhygromyxa sp. WMMC2535]|uniref:hypothetical protein n=1 Tax=Pseudenhygromyxa sp. WMMC2535 TaxID=2712867 RepID=UPI001595EABF|nr:hypothetical protein [Pseudenhygromyxa sp. WMMC2535]NVB37407.1 hypothetical protein [Pseudenhygromyxa sp. WMMC2535]